MLLNSDIVDFVWKTDEGKQKTLFCLFLFFSGALIVDGLRVVGCYRKYYLGLEEIASFF